MKKIICGILLTQSIVLGAKEIDKTKESIDIILQVNQYSNHADKIIQSTGSTLTVEEFMKKFREAYEQPEVQASFKEIFEKKFTTEQREEIYAFINSPLYKKCVPGITAFNVEISPLMLPILMKALEAPIAEQASTAVETGKVVSVNESNFEEVLQAHDKVIVDVYATWCGPCKALSPIFEQLSEEFDEKCTFVKLDADANQALLQKLNVKALPTILVYKGGKEVHRKTGFANKDQLTEILNRYFGG